MTTAVLTQPKAAPAQPLQPHRWTIAEYRELDKTGIFHDVKTMLLDGELYVMPMPSPLHDTALAKVEDFLRNTFAQGFHVRSQKAFDIGTRNDPGPDLAVVPGSIDDYTEQHPTVAILIVEVSATSLTSDTTTKAELYASARVPEYWVIDVTNRQLHIFRDPVAQPTGRGANAYRTRQTLSAEDAVSPSSAPTALIKVADLFAESHVVLKASASRLTS